MSGSTTIRFGWGIILNAESLIQYLRYSFLHDKPILEDSWRFARPYFIGIAVLHGVGRYWAAHITI
jgi:hypothetical protein